MRIRRSGYYAWKRSKPRKRAVEDELMKRMMGPVFIESKLTYGGRRLKASSKKAGVITSRRRMCRLMKEEGIVPKQVDRWHPQTTQADEKHEKVIINRSFKMNIGMAAV
jgi:putative transposase